MPQELITQAEYARRRKVSREAVRKAVAAGRITLIRGKVDPEVANIQWERNTDLHQSLRANAQKMMGEGGGAPDGGAHKPDGAHAPEGSGTDLLSARTRFEQARAENEELDLQQRRGLLVVAVDVRRTAHDVARQAREMLTGIPDRLATQLAVESDPAKVHAMLDAEILRVCEALANPAGLPEAPLEA